MSVLLKQMLHKLVIAIIRVSTKNQAKNGYGIEAQKEDAIKQAVELGYKSENVFFYLEDGFRGINLKRPSLTSFWDLIKSGNVELVLYPNIDRIGRDQRSIYQTIFMLEDFNVDYIICGHAQLTGYNKAAFISNQSLAAAHDYKRINTNTTKGREHSVKNGNIMPNGCGILGYIRINKQLHIVEDEAVIVRRIFELSSQGVSTRRIIEVLAEEGYTPKTSYNKFSPSTIHSILTNATYMGIYTYNENITEFIPGAYNDANHQKRRIVGKRSEDEIITVNVDAIVSVELFELANHQLKNRNTKKGNSAKYFYLVSGLVTCADCGTNFEHTTFKTSVKEVTQYYTVYRCPKKKIEACCISKTAIRGADLDSFIWQLVESELLTDANINKLIHNSSQLSNTNNHDVLTKKLSKSKEDIINKITQLTKAYTAGTISEYVFDHSIKNLSEEVESIDKQLLALTEAKTLFDKECDEVLKVINTPFTNEAKKDVINKLIRRIYVKYHSKTHFEILIDWKYTPQ